MNIRIKIITLLLLAWVPAIFAQETKSPPKAWTLEDCLAYATTNNITIKQAEFTKQTAEVNYAQSKYQRLPSLTGSASQTMNNGTSIDPITSNYVSQLVHSTSVGVNAQVTLFNGNYINNTIRENELLTRQNAYFVSEAKNNITLSVTEAYLKALYYKEGITVAQNTVASSQEQLAQVNKRYKAGSVAGIDVADLQTQLSNDQYSLVTAQNNYRQQIITLKQLLELDPAQEFEIATPQLPQSETLIPQLQDVYQTALHIMPEIESAKMQTEIEGYDLKLARAGYLPTLSLMAGVNSGYTNTRDFDFFTQLNGNFYQNVGLSLSIPIFSKYKNNAAVANAKISIEQSKLTAASTTKQLYLKIESVWQNAVSAQSEMEAALNLRNSSKLAYEMAEKKATVGSLNSTDLLVSKNTYLSAEQKYLQTKFSNALYYQLLQFYQGNSIKI